MAKVNGPLLSLNASGTVGKTILFSNWNGRQTCALKNTPSKRRTVSQMRARAYLKCALALSKYISRTSSSYLRCKEIALSGETWSSALTKVILKKRNEGIEYCLGLYEEPFVADIIPIVEEAADYFGIASIDIDGTENTQFTGGFLVFVMYVIMIDRLYTAPPPPAGLPTEKEVYDAVTLFTGIPNDL